MSMKFKEVKKLLSGNIVFECHSFDGKEIEFYSLYDYEYNPMFPKYFAELEEMNVYMIMPTYDYNDYWFSDNINNAVLICFDCYYEDLKSPEYKQNKVMKG